jgi:hypothetical protein
MERKLRTGLNIFHSYGGKYSLPYLRFFSVSHIPSNPQYSRQKNESLNKYSSASEEEKDIDALLSELEDLLLNTSLHQEANPPTAIPNAPYMNCTLHGKSRKRNPTLAI